MKKTKTSMKVVLGYDKEFRVQSYKIIPVTINVKGFMIAEDAERIRDQIVKSIECSDKLLEGPKELPLIPKDGQYAWVEIDNCGELEMAKYRKEGDKWYDFADDPGAIEGNRVRVYKLIQMPKL